MTERIGSEAACTIV